MRNNTHIHFFSCSFQGQFWEAFSRILNPGLFLLLVIMRGGFCEAATLKICSTCPNQSVQSGVTQASEGDTLWISRGVYNESGIEIRKPLTLIGEKGAVLDGGGKGIIHILADRVSILGITFRNVTTSYTKDQAAIHIFRSSNFAILDNNLKDVFFGILVEKSHKGEIQRNHIQSQAKEEYNSGNGIHLWHCTEVLINNNEVTGMRDGIYFEFVERTLIYDNLSYKNVRYGLHFMFSSNNEYFDNTFRNNGAGVAVMFSKKIIMCRNSFIKNWGTASYGLLLKEIYDAEIEDNLFEENTIGINSEGSNRINYRHNNFMRNGWAVKITGACYENAFMRNNFLYNAFDVSYEGEINQNYFSHNFWSEYTGYDLDKNGVGDIPFRPVKLFSYIVNKTPETIVLLRSLFVDIINFSEKVSPVFTPDNLLDEQPQMSIML